MAIDWSKLIYAKSSTPHLDTFNRLKDSYTADANTEIAGIEKNRDTDLEKSNAGYDNTARQNWVNYMQAQKRLPSQLNSLGIRGGASESSLLRLGTNYGTNVANNEAARQTAANDIRNAYAKQISDVRSNLATRLAQAQAEAEQNQLKWESEQKEKDLQYFSGAIEGLYKNKDDYKKLIAQLKASNDPNRDVKIMLATRAMNMLAGSGSSGGGGGGGYSRSRSYGGYGGSGGDNTTNNSSGSTAYYNAAKAAVDNAAAQARSRAIANRNAAIEQAKKRAAKKTTTYTRSYARR